MFHAWILVFTSKTRHRTSTSMYSLTLRVRVTTPRSMDEMERRTQQARRFYRRRGESSQACVACVCGMRAACGVPGGLPLGSATHFHSVAIATQRVQIRPVVHNYGASPTTPPSYIRVRAIMWACGRRQTDTHAQIHADARDHNTFLVIYDSREMKKIVKYRYLLHMSA